MNWQTVATAAKNATPIFDDDIWDVEDNSKAEKPKVYLDYNTPPLGLVIAMQEAGKQNYEIYERLVGTGKLPHVRAESVVSIEHQAAAATMYDYFAKKHTLRRLKGEFVSKFMLAIDDICENRTRINLEHLKILITMPRCYEQNRALERIMNNHKSLKPWNSKSFAAFHNEVKFVERVHIKMTRTNEYHYYFSTSDNHLMRIVVKNGTHGVTAWDTLSKFERLYIDTEAVYSSAITGYDFNVLEPVPSLTEVKIL